MKKFISILLAVLLVSAMLVLPAGAFLPEEEVESTNVALGKNYEISGIGNRSDYYGNVTDGNAVMNLGNNKSSDWFGFYHNGDRPTNAPDKLGYFIIDLEEVYSVDTIRVGLIKNDGWGIPAPEYVKAYGSLDGSAFEELGSFAYELETGVGVWTEISTKANARYIKIEVKLAGTFAFVNEVEVYGVKGGAADDENLSVEEKMQKALGEKFDDAKFDLDITAPKTYKAGDDVTVTVAVKNITAENGLHVVSFNLFYDNEKLVLANDLDENDYNIMLCVKSLPEGWENLSYVTNDYDESNGEATEVKPLNDGVINAIALTDSISSNNAIKEDGELVFEFNFKALEDAEGEIGMVIPHAYTEGAYNTTYGADVYTANGDYAVIEKSLIDIPEPNGSIEDSLKEALGTASDDAKVDYVIEAPETYKAGDEITVKVYVRNITAENGIHLTEFKLYYDNTKLLITNDIDEEDDNILVCVEKAPNAWGENFSRVNNDYNEDNEEGTEVKPLNDGVIIASIFTDKTTASSAVKEDDQVIFAFTFKVLDGAEGELGFVIPHAETESALNTKNGVEQYTANGGYAITHAAVVLKGKAPTCTEDGLTDGVYCPDCGKIIVEQETIPALGHDDGEWTTTVEPTEDKGGEAERRCTVCDKVLETKELPPLRLLGDVDGDRDIDKYDYLMVKRAVMGTLDLDEIGLKAADVNKNGDPDKYDYLYIKRHVLGTYVIEGTI